jgi:uncharacterized Fe-S cluster-containing radical SAM superfamily protein
VPLRRFEAGSRTTNKLQPVKVNSKILRKEFEKIIKNACLKYIYFRNVLYYGGIVGFPSITLSNTILILL